MKQLLALVCVLAVVGGCAAPGQDTGETPQTTAAAPVQLDVQTPEPLPVPEYKTASSEEDWPARVNNKDKEIVEVLNIIRPVAAYITAGFEGYGNRFSPTLHEEWEDTQAQLTQAMTLYDDCKGRIESSEFDKKLFLDMENVWQILVKTGVAGVRTKSMVDSELAGITG